MSDLNDDVSDNKDNNVDGQKFFFPPWPHAIDLVIGGIIVVLCVKIWYEIEKTSLALADLSSSAIAYVSLLLILLICMYFRLPVFQGCSPPNYLCCNDDEYGLELTCEPCEDCCLMGDAVSRNGLPTKCPAYCNCLDTYGGYDRFLFPPWPMS